MRNSFLLVVAMSLTSLYGMAQSSGQSSGTKPPVHHTGQPTAIIETTAGNMTCTLFPDKAPIGVQNFIGLATGTKEWKNPVSGVTKHGVPLYDGTIFHRVIPGFTCCSISPAALHTRTPALERTDPSSLSLKWRRRT
jgi:Cyclophilin type peptidyl-prolyl cis-trans isomerase/CLD